jgi:hypothetical protein
LTFLVLLFRVTSTVVMKSKTYLSLIIFIYVTLPAVFSESWIIPLGDPVYEQAEELFISDGKVPPLEELPLVADELKNALSGLAASSSDPDITRNARNLDDSIVLPLPVFNPILEVGFSMEHDSETGRQHMIPTYDLYDNPADPGNTGPDKSILDFNSMYEINELPSVIKAGFSVQAGGFSLLFAPEIRETTTGLLEDDNLINIPLDLTQINYYSLPFRAISAYYSPPFEVRLGRDKLKLGPSRWCGMTLNSYMPYYDYLKARLFVPGFSFSCYIINLNPIITSNESEYLNNLTTDEYKKLENNGPKNGDPYMDRFKNLILSRVAFTPWEWLSFTFTQCNLIGGRPPEISDFNPLLVFHNNFDEGTYSVPVSLSVTYVPYKGIRLYGEFYFYDAPAGDETVPTENPLAIAYQVGLTVLSNPFFSLGPGRFRLDAEFSYADPWTYGKAYDLRKFTSRIVYVESFVGRYWVDYPLGFYLGPDVIDIHFCLGYGIPGQWEAELHWNTTAKGQVDMYGWGADNDYYHIGEPGFALGFAPSGTAAWTNSLTLSGYLDLGSGVTVSAWYRLSHIKNRYNIADHGGFFHYAGVSVLWKIY